MNGSVGGEINKISSKGEQSMGSTGGIKLKRRVVKLPF